MFIAALFTIAKIEKQPSVHQQMMDREEVVYYSTVKGNEILPFVTTRVDPEGIMLGEISQTEKDKYRMISLICRI